MHPQKSNASKYLSRTSNASKFQSLAALQNAHEYYGGNRSNAQSCPSGTSIGDQGCMWRCENDSDCEKFISKSSLPDDVVFKCDYVAALDPHHPDLSKKACTFYPTTRIQCNQPNSQAKTDALNAIHSQCAKINASWTHNDAASNAMAAGGDTASGQPNCGPTCCDEEPSSQADGDPLYCL